MVRERVLPKVARDGDWRFTLWVWWQKGEGVKLRYYFGKQEGMKGQDAWAWHETRQQAVEVLPIVATTCFQWRRECVFVTEYLWLLWGSWIPYFLFNLLTFMVEKYFFLIILFCLTFFTFRNIIVKVVWKKHKKSQLSNTILVIHHLNAKFSLQDTDFLWFTYDLWQPSQI